MPWDSDTGYEFAPVLIGVLFAMLVVMVAAWGFQRLARNTGWVDAFWTFGTGAVLAVAALAPEFPNQGPNSRQMLVATLVALWALRLGGYIALRVLRDPHEDTRYAGLREKWGAKYQSNLFVFVLIQAPAATLLAVSVILASRDPAPDLGPRDALAVLIWIVAVVGEMTADNQMAAFRKNPANKGGINDRGLWAWSRHPNYFFEWVVWLAYPVIALQTDDPASWWSLTAPVIMFALLRFGTGVPALERSMLASRGERFRDYQARTSAFFPMPPRRKA